MNLPQIVSRDGWLAARKELLTKEKEATRARDALNTQRRMLPMVRIGKDYVFDGPDGTASLLDLFAGRRQLIVDHVMFHPDWQDACSSCIADVEELGAGLYRHLHARVTTLVHVSRAALPTIEAYQARRGWSIPWYSSYGSDFNYDFGVTLDDSVTPAVYNYRTRAEHQQAGTGYYLAGEQPVEVPGLSCFLRDGDAVFHTYSTYGRGDEMTGGAYYYLDLTALGRQEDWEQPHGRADHARRGVPDFAE